MAASLSTSTSTPPKLYRLLSADRPDWGAIIAQLRDSPEEALYVDQATSHTALHLALASSRQQEPGQDDDDDDDGGKAGPNSAEQRRGVVKTLLALHPKAAARRCRGRGNTPLAAACRTARLETIPDDAKLVKILIMANQRPINTMCDQGLPPLLIHIRSVSLLMFQEDARTTTRGGDPKRTSADESSVSASTAILDVLGRYASQAQLEQAIEDLYRCNTLATMTLVANEEAIARRDRLLFGLDEPRPSATLAGQWIWEWLLVLLRHVSNRLGNKSSSSGRPRSSSSSSSPSDLYPLHVASQIPGCPPPFVLLAIRAFPRDVQTALDSTTNNLPAHQVAVWTRREASGTDDDVAPPNGSTWCRRSMCLTALDAEHPPGMHAKNSLGKTPLELEAETEHGATLVSNA
jgi:hypothetical protein